MEWRIRESGNGRFVAEKGIFHTGGESFPGIIGVTMLAFILYESATFETEKEAKNYIKRKCSENF
ncbi:MAG: hypothetical protein ACLVEV_10020 [Lachnospiraceae bacterium]